MFFFKESELENGSDPMYNSQVIVIFLLRAKLLTGHATLVEEMVSNGGSLCSLGVQRNGLRCLRKMYQ